MNKKIYITMIILLVIIIVGGLIILLTGQTTPTNANTNDTENIQINNENRQDENNNVMNNEIENTESENTQTQNTQQAGSSNSSETFEQAPKTEEEKVTAIVKKDYGENKNVKFTVEGMDANGAYIVAVRDISTTEALVFYTVKVSDGTFTKREMN